jgi:hypothetical protein
MGLLNDAVEWVIFHIWETSSTDSLMLWRFKVQGSERKGWCCSSWSKSRDDSCKFFLILKWKKVWLGWIEAFESSDQSVMSVAPPTLTLCRTKTVLPQTEPRLMDGFASIPDNGTIPDLILFSGWTIQGSRKGVPIPWSRIESQKKRGNQQQTHVTVTVTSKFKLSGPTRAGITRGRSQCYTFHLMNTIAIQTQRYCPQQFKSRVFLCL